jgi:hypothetical protein
MKEEYNRLFDKLFAIQEKTIIAMDRMSDKHESTDDNIEKLIGLIEKKITTDEKFIFWLKVISTVLAAVTFAFFGGG